MIELNTGYKHFNLTFKLSGNSALPAYPGFIVMNIVQVGSIEISVPSKINDVTPSITAV